ncbi:MAG: bacterioferritin [Chloroflexi bacterium]|nr:bacterioferritin [Chloroflexota bacterium]
MNQKVIDLLNEARARELGAISQYMTQHYELEDTQFGKLAERLKAIGVEEMRHAEALAERILFLGGLPVTKPSGETKRKEEIPALLRTDIGLEQEAVAMYNRSAGICAQEGDNVSRNLFEKLAKEEEEHLDEFENTADHVDKLGAAYLATLTG